MNRKGSGGEVMSTTGSILTSAAILLSAAALAQAQSPPVGYWKGDDGVSPTQALNSSTNVKDGTYTGGATTDSTNKPALLFPNTSSMSFNGTSSYVNISGFTWPTGGGPVTVSFWNYVVTAQSSAAFTVGNQGNPSRFLAHAPWSDQNIYWDYGDQAGTGRISTSYAAKLGQWCHVGLVSAGLTGSFKAIYLDGVLAVSDSGPSSGPTSALTGINIGAWTGASSYHNGLIDDFRIYDRVLSAAEIQALAAGNTEVAAPIITSVVAGIGQVDIAWTPVIGATSYNVKYGTTWGGPYPTVVPVTGTSTTLTGLTYSTQYYFVVSSVNALGESLNSLQDTAKVMGPPRTTVVGTNKNHCGVGVSSDPSAGVLGVLLVLAILLPLCGRRAPQRILPKATLR
jgi:hypothetical protein